MAPRWCFFNPKLVIFIFISGKDILIFPVKLSSCKCHKTLLVISPHLFRKWLGAWWHQAITWTNVVQVLWHHMVSLILHADETCCAREANHETWNWIVLSQEKIWISEIYECSHMIYRWDMMWEKLWSWFLKCHTLNQENNIHITKIPDLLVELIYIVIISIWHLHIIDNNDINCNKNATSVMQTIGNKE